MGNIIRMLKYDKTKNIINSVPILHLNDNQTLRWYRLDDGVMGGQSTTLVDELNSSSCSNVVSPGEEDQSVVGTKRVGNPPILKFTGSINTQGGGFASIRANLPDKNVLSLDESYNAFKIKYRGDGKTYKILLSNSSGSSSGGPFSRSPSWQADLPTIKKLRTPACCPNSNNNEGKRAAEKEEKDLSFQESIIYFSSFLPSFGGKAALTDFERKKYTLIPSEIRQLGLMLSLKLCNGQPNPPETFGVGIFSFILEVESIEAVRM